MANAIIPKHYGAGIKTDLNIGQMNCRLTSCDISAVNSVNQLPSLNKHCQILNDFNSKT